MFKNLVQLQKHFNSELICIEYIEKQRWNGKPECPHCGSEHHYRTSTRLKHPELAGYKDFWCKACNKKFTTLTGSIYASTKINLVQWISAVYLITAHKKGISSIQLGKDLGVTQKTAWFILHRIRESLKANGLDTMKGTIEADETYLGRKYRSDYKGLSEEQIDYIKAHKSSTRNKGAILGLADRATGEIRVFAFGENNGENVFPVIREHVEAGSNLHTDETKLYNRLEGEYKRSSVAHNKREWAKTTITGERIHTNHVENFWSVMKRGVYGIYHQISYKHLQAYCNEFSYRYNSREIGDADRFELAVAKCGSARLTYPQLINKEDK